MRVMSPAGIFFLCITSIAVWMWWFGREFDDRQRYSIWSILAAMTIVGASAAIARLVF
jgi:hypothetical protein